MKYDPIKTGRQGDGAIERDDIDLMELARTLWRGKLVIAATAMCLMAVGAYYTMVSATPMYTARATVALENRQEQVIGIEAAMSGLSGDQATINTESEVLRSRRLAEQLVRDLNLLADPEFNPTLRDPPWLSLGALRRVVKGPSAPPSESRVFNATTNNVMGAFSIANIRSSYVFTITAVTERPEKSAMLANALGEIYVKDQVAVKNEATEQGVVWLSQRVASLRSDLERAERQYQQFASESSLVSPEALEALNRQIKSTRDRLAEVQVAIAGQEAWLTRLKQATDGGDRAAIAALADDAALDRLVSSEADPQAFGARLDEILSDADQSLQRSEAQLQSLTDGLRHLERNYGDQSKDMVVLEQYRREADAARSLYEFFLTRMKELSVQTGTQQPDSRVLSAAIEPAGASSPRTTRILGFMMILGLLLGAAVVIVREMLQDGFRTAEELEAETGVTVMGQIPTIPTKRRGDTLTYLRENPASPAAEAVRNLRTSLMLSNIDAPPQVILVSSSLPGEGKTTNAISLAMNYAGLGKKVLLVEGDIRRRVYGEYFIDVGEAGFVGFLTGAHDFDEIVKTEVALGIDLIPGNNSKTNAADIFSSARFSDFVKTCRTRYEVVIIDTPPVLVVPDARIIAHHVDAVVFTVKWDRTTKTQVSSAIRQFTSAGTRVTGLVLGQIDPRGMKRYGYGERYGSYASYGSGYYAG